MKPAKISYLSSLLLTAFLLVSGALPVQALQQLQHPTFLSNWTNLTPVDGIALNPFLIDPGFADISGNSWQGENTVPAGGPAIVKADGYIQLPFPEEAKASETNILVQYSSQVVTDSQDWGLSMAGTIRDVSNETTVYGQFYTLNLSGIDPLTVPWAAAIWTGSLEATEADCRLFRIYWNIRNFSNKKSVSCWISDVYLHMSPCGLSTAASDTAILLDWYDSEAGAGCNELAAANGYRIYRRIDPAAAWTQVGTSTTSAWSDTSPPFAENIYYCVSDVDSGGYESPKSPETIYKPARLVIDEITSSHDTVTIGQVAFVHVHLRNSGYSTLTIDELALEFEGPASAAYILATPTLPVPLAGLASTTLTFQVQIDADLSAPGMETIDAQATGTANIGGHSLPVYESTIKKDWTLRAPATLEVIDITVPERVYRGEEGVTIYVTAFNNGGENAAGDWLSSEFTFSPIATDYTNLRLHASDTLPVQISANNTATIRYQVDVKTTAATGTCEIENRIRYQDVNLLMPLWTNWEDSPFTSWTVLAGRMRTFQSSSYLAETSSYNQGDTKVYAKASNLDPVTSYQFRWFNPAGTEVHTSPPLSTDELGVRTYEYQLTVASPLGKWRVIATKPLSNSPLAEAYFWVVAPASISVELDLPDYAVLNRTFIATMTMTNSGGAAVDPAYPGTIYKLGTNSGDADLVSGPSPATLIISGNASSTFSWQFLATDTGTFAIEAQGFADDANSYEPLETATQTSNTCLIQTAPNLSVTGVYESYDIVAPGQANLIVSMNISNTGDASVYVDAASLTFIDGTHTQVYASPPVMPFLLSGNSVSTIVFDVAVDQNSATGAVEITGSFSAYEVHAPNYTYGIEHGGPIGSWTVDATPYGEISANVSFIPQQYNFNQGQKMYVRFNGIPYPDPDGKVSIMFYDTETPPDPAIRPGDGEQRSLTLGASGNVSVDWLVPTTATITKWCVAVYDQDGTGASQYAVGPPLCFQNFWVEEPGVLDTTLTITPAEVDLGQNITITMSLANEPTGNSKISPATATLPIKLAGSTGAAATWVSGPTPASATVQPGYPATFTWVYKTTEYSAFGSFQMIASASGSDYNTRNSDPADKMIATDTATSNAIRIYSRSIDLEPEPLNLGLILPGETKVLAGIIASNTGNATMTNVQWEEIRPKNALNFTVPLENFAFSPSTGFSLSAPGSTAASFTLTLPYNQASGTYQSTMRIYDDLNSDTQRQVGEPYDDFIVTLTASECRILTCAPALIDLGGCAPGDQTSAKTIFVFSGGNLALDNVTFKSLESQTSSSTFTFNPATIGSISVGVVEEAEVYVMVGADEEPGTYIATWTVWDDRSNYNVIDDGEASATFQIQFRVGNKYFEVAPDPLDLGSGDPNSAIENVVVTINNNVAPGDLAIIKPAAVIGELVHAINPLYKISADKLLFELPAGPIPSGTVSLATISIFLPPGSLAGSYTGSITIYDDEDGDGIPDGNAIEYECTLPVEVRVNVLNAIDVLTSTLDVTGMLPGDTKAVGFQFRNIGSTDLAGLQWTKVDLTEPAFGFTILASAYDFTPIAPIPALCGQVVNATITITIAADQKGGNYAGITPATLLNADAQDSFAVKCQIGTMAIDIVEAGPLLATGTPNASSSEAILTLKNTGALVLALPMVMAKTDMVDVSTIPAAAAVFTPQIYSFINKGSIRTGLWGVQIPARTPVGTYTGTIIAWNDENGDNLPDNDEASDTVDVSLAVLGDKSLTVSPVPVEPPVTPPGLTAAGSFVIQNTGNLSIDATTIIAGKLTLTSGGAEIDASHISFSAVASNLPFDPVEDSFDTVTVSIAIPLGQVKGTYKGDQTISFDGKTATFSLQITVGEKKIGVTNPVVMGTTDPPAVLSKKFNVTNESATIPLESIRWLRYSLVSAEANTIDTSMFSLTPAGFSLGTSGVREITASMTIPIHHPPGVYVATQTVYDDQNLNGTYDAGEASKSFQLSVTVNTFPKIDMFTISPLDLGEIEAASSSAEVTISYKNIGNVDLTLNWLEADMLLIPGAGDAIPPAEIVFSAPAPATLTPGATGGGTVSISPSSDRSAGDYSGLQILQDGAYAVGFPGHVGNLTLECRVKQSYFTPELASGSVYQELATNTLATTAEPSMSWIVSTWVTMEPIASAAVYLYTHDSINPDTRCGIQIDASGNVSELPDSTGITGGGVSTTIKTDDKTWYRVYFSFDFHNNTASNAYIVLQNTTEYSLASQSVWFDGVQVEKAMFPNQTRPTAYGPGSKLISPNRSQTLQGDRRYFEW